MSGAGLQRRHLPGGSEASPLPRPTIQFSPSAQNSITCPISHLNLKPQGPSRLTRGGPPSQNPPRAGPPSPSGAQGPARAQQPPSGHTYTCRLQRPQCLAPELVCDTNRQGARTSGPGLNHVCSRNDPRIVPTKGLPSAGRGSEGLTGFSEDTARQSRARADSRQQGAQPGEGTSWCWRSGGRSCQDGGEGASQNTHNGGRGTATTTGRDAPLESPPQQHSPISVFKHWPEAVSQIRLQRKTAAGFTKRVRRRGPRCSGSQANADFETNAH